MSEHVFAITGIVLFGHKSLARTDVGYSPNMEQTQSFSPLILPYLNVRQQIREVRANNRILRLWHWTDIAFLPAD